jgi:hypothetical protein
MFTFLLAEATTKISIELNFKKKLKKFKKLKKLNLKTLIEKQCPRRQVRSETYNS